MSDEMDALKGTVEGLFDSVEDQLEGDAKELADDILDDMKEDLKKYTRGEWSKVKYKRISERRLESMKRLATGAVLAARNEAKEVLLAFAKDFGEVLVSSLV
jgi:hypothetical protein